MPAQVSARTQNEIARSASEASKTIVKPIDVRRYLNPLASTPFPLEYAFYLLGDVKGKTVLDLGCGSGEELIPLLHRGAKAIGIDISPDLIALSERRLTEAGLNAVVRVGSAYETALPDASVDVVFCMSLIHHLEIPRVRQEMLRILRPGGFVVLKEPIRFNKAYSALRSVLTVHEDVSDYEHPLTKEEFREVQKGFDSDGLRFFRLPFVPLVQRNLPIFRKQATLLSNWIVATFPGTAHFATIATLRLSKPV